mgnify:FL=1
MILIICYSSKVLITIWWQWAKWVKELFIRLWTLLYTALIPKGRAQDFSKSGSYFYLGAKTLVVCNRKCRLASFLYVIQKVQHCYVPAGKKSTRIFVLRLARTRLVLHKMLVKKSNSAKTHGADRQRKNIVVVLPAKTTLSFITEGATWNHRIHFLWVMVTMVMPFRVIVNNLKGNIWGIVWVLTPKLKHRELSFSSF